MSAVFPVLSPHSPLQAMAAPPTSLAVAYQGAPGAYSEGAAAKAVPGCQPLPCKQFESAFEALSQWRAERAVLPIENSLGGSIHAVYDLLLKCARSARLRHLGSEMRFGRLMPCLVRMQPRKSGIVSACRVGCLQSAAAAWPVMHPFPSDVGVRCVHTCRLLNQCRSRMPG